MPHHSGDITDNQHFRINSSLARLLSLGSINTNNDRTTKTNHVYSAAIRS